MKRYVRMISLTLALLLSVLVMSGGAGAESAEVNISGTLRASSLADGAAVRLIGDTTLILDAPKTVTSISGEYKLSLRGAETFTIKNPAGPAVDVGSLLIRGSVAAEGEYGLRAEGVGAFLDALGRFAPRPAYGPDFAARVYKISRDAQGNRLMLVIAEKENHTDFVITNNGNPPKGEIAESGGLLSLRRSVEETGGTMTVQSQPVFSLTIKL